MNRFRRWLGQEPPVLMQWLVLALVVCWFLKIWWGHPDTIYSYKKNAGSVLFEGVYYLFLYSLLFGFSRTVSLKSLLKWFYLGWIVVPFTVYFVQKWMLTWEMHTMHYFKIYAGTWGNRHSLHHASLTGPISEEILKALPLLLFWIVILLRKSIRSYTLSDWLLIGMALGSGFDTAETFIWIQGQHTGWFAHPHAWPYEPLNFLIPYTRNTSPFWNINASWSFVTGAHPVWTAYVGLAIGAAAYLSRKGWRWRVWAWTLPFAALIVVTIEHSLGNLTYWHDNQFLSVPLIRGLLFIFGNGAVLTYGFGLVVLGIAVFEGLRIHPVEREALNRYGSYLYENLRALGVVLGAFTAASFSAYTQNLIRDFKWPKLWGIPVFFVTWVSGFINLSIDFIITQWRFARVRHAAAWSAS